MGIFTQTHQISHKHLLRYAFMTWTRRISFPIFWNRLNLPCPNFINTYLTLCLTSGIILKKSCSKFYLNFIRHISYGSPTKIVHTKFYYIFSFKHLLQNCLSYLHQIYYVASPAGPRQKLFIPSGWPLGTSGRRVN